MFGFVLYCVSMQYPPSVELADVILKRQECLHTLSDQPQTKPELVETLDIPRSTLDDIIRELEHADLVEYCDGKWQLTLLGQYTLTHQTCYMNGLDSLMNAAQVIRELPRATNLERRFLINVDVHMATSPVPDEVMQVFIDKLVSATHVRCVAPIALTAYLKPIYNSIGSNNNGQLEVILPVEACERIQTLNSGLGEKTIAGDGVTVYHAEIPITFTLWIADDDHAGLIVYADKGIQGILINDTDAALDWANKQYDCTKKDAEPIIDRGSHDFNAG